MELTPKEEILISRIMNVIPTEGCWRDVEYKSVVITVKNMVKYGVDVETIKSIVRRYYVVVKTPKTKLDHG